MESSAFSNKIKMKLKMYKLMNIYVPWNYINAQQAVCVFTGNIRKTPFSILIATQREMHQSKIAKCKNLVHTKGQILKFVLSMDTNTLCQTQYLLLAPIYTSVKIRSLSATVTLQKKPSKSLNWRRHANSLLFGMTFDRMCLSQKFSSHLIES